MDRILRKSGSIFFRGTGIFILVLSLYLSGCSVDDIRESVPEQTSNEGTPLEEETIDRLQSILDRATSAAFLRGVEVDPDIEAMPAIPGVIVGISVQGKQDWYGVSGLSDRESRTPLKVDDNFRIGSITKTFVGTLILKLSEERDDFSLEDSVEKWLPGIVKNGENINIKNLLTHSSCLYNYVQVSVFTPALISNPFRRWTPEELVNLANHHDPYCTTPGTEFHYANTNYVLLGMIAETMTRKTIDDLLNTHFFDPLGLDNTYYLTAGETKIPGDHSSGYIDSNSDFVLEKMVDWSLSGFGASGSMVSNIKDTMKWMKAIAGLEGNLLSAELQAERFGFSAFIESPSLAVPTDSGMSLLRRNGAYKLTDQSLSNLQIQGVPNEILGQLESLKDQEYNTKIEFLAVVEATIGTAGFESYRNLILEYEDKSDVVIGHVGAVYGYSVYAGYYVPGQTTVVVFTNRDEYALNRAAEMNVFTIMDTALQVLFPDYNPGYSTGTGY